MSIGEELAAFRGRFPGCSIVAFADLSTGMILAANTKEKVAQENLDELCETAFQSFTGSVSKAIARELTEGSKDQPRIYISAQDDQFTCFLRAKHPAEEAICIVMSHQVSLPNVMRAADDLLDRVAVET